MAKKVALVLSGGGAKGAFQYRAEKYAREEKNYKWDIIAGVSVGALNGTMLAMENYERLDELWGTIKRSDIMTGKLNFWAVFKLLFGAKSVYGNKPLRRLIQEEVDPNNIKIDLRVGTVSLQTGEYKQHKPADPGLKKLSWLQRPFRSFGLQSIFLLRKPT